MHSLQVQRQTGEFRSSNWNRHLLWKATWRRTDSDQPKIFLVNLASESITLPVHQDDSVHNSGRSCEQIRIERIPLLASPQGGAAERLKRFREASADREAGVVFRLKTKS